MTDATAGGPAPTDQLPAQGWYPDPAGSGQLRWWDGAAWTGAFHPDSVQPPRAPLADHRRPPLTQHFPTLARLTEISLLACAAAAAFSAYSAWRLRDLASRLIADADSVDLAAADAVDRLELLSGIGTFITFAITAGLFITWLYQAHRSDQVYPPALRHSSGWAIGAWFVPFLNLVRPAQIVGDVTRGAARAKAVEPSSDRLVSAWWGSLLISNFAGTAAARYMRTADGEEDGMALLTSYRTAATVDIVADLLLLAAAILCLVLVRRTTRMLLSRPGQPVT